MELDKESLLKLYPPYTSVGRPSKRKSDGRLIIILYNNNVPVVTKGRSKGMSYPKALVEASIGERLLPNETIDHDDRDIDNNDVYNLVIKDRSQHASEDALRVNIPDVPCIACNKIFKPSQHQINNRAKTKAGPFCSKQCTGLYGARVQNGAKELDRKEIPISYYRVEKGS